MRHPVEPDMAEGPGDAGEKGVQDTNHQEHPRQHQEIGSGLSGDVYAHRLTPAIEICIGVAARIQSDLQTTGRRIVRTRWLGLYEPFARESTRLMSTAASFMPCSTDAWCRKAHCTACDQRLPSASNCVEGFQRHLAYWSRICCQFS